MEISLFMAPCLLSRSYGNIKAYSDKHAVLYMCVLNMVFYNTDIYVHYYIDIRSYVCTYVFRVQKI